MSRSGYDQLSTIYTCMHMHGRSYNVAEMSYVAQTSTHDQDLTKTARGCMMGSLQSHQSKHTSARDFKLLARDLCPSLHCNCYYGQMLFNVETWPMESSVPVMSRVVVSHVRGPNLCYPFPLFTLCTAAL